MGRYDRTYGTDWETLDVDEAVDRAYALGVAASLGERHPDEREAIRDEMDSAYTRSVVDLAFDEGKNEARETDADGSSQRIWTALVTEESVSVGPENASAGDRTGLLEAIDRMDALDRVDIDSTEAVDRPSFLERE